MAEAEKWGWEVQMSLVEAGCRGFVAKSTTRVLREVGVKGQAHSRAVKAFTNTVGRSSHWL